MIVDTAFQSAFRELAYPPRHVFPRRTEAARDCMAHRHRKATAPIDAWLDYGLRLVSTDGVCARGIDVYRDETLHESDARCSDSELQIQ